VRGHEVGEEWRRGRIEGAEGPREGGEEAGEGEISRIVEVVVQVQSGQVDKLGG
jgi:hypothetical protein